MATFQRIKEFNEELQSRIKRFEWNIEAGSYEDLKKNPEAYSTYEDEDYLRFFVKDRINGRIKNILIITATAYDPNDGIKIKADYISAHDLVFLNRITKGDQWWLQSEEDIPQA